MIEFTEMVLPVFKGKVFPPSFSLREELHRTQAGDLEPSTTVYKDWSFNGDYDADGRPAPTEIRFVCKNRVGPGIANLASLHRLNLFNGYR